MLQPVESRASWAVSESMGSGIWKKTEALLRVGGKRREKGVSEEGGRGRSNTPTPLIQIFSSIVMLGSI